MSFSPFEILHVVILDFLKPFGPSVIKIDGIPDITLANASAFEYPFGLRFRAAATRSMPFNWKVTFKVY
jgi:hypothetical protein